MRAVTIVATLFFALFLGLDARGISSQPTHIGRCPSIDVQQSFDAEAYMGVWYEQAHYNTAQYEGDDAQCVTAHYALNSTSGVVSVTNVAGRSGSKVSIEGTAVLDDASKDEGKLTVTFNIAGMSVKGMYWVLSTDYQNYSVVYACTNHHLIFHYYTVWYLGRNQTFSSTADQDNFFKTADQVLKSHRLNPSIMIATNQTNCDA